MVYAKFGNLVATVILVAASFFVSGAHALELVETRTDFNDPQAQQVISGLMEPILPLVANGASTTTSVLQLGVDNYAASSVSGDASFAGIVQGGDRNRAVQAIQGSNSAMLLVQGGTDNNVFQASAGDNNFQLVALGESSKNNNVGYIQVGNELAGALNVGNSQNSTVMALQTEQSGRYLMPAGISGLNNQVVVIVPGRMYVFQK